METPVTDLTIGDKVIAPNDREAVVIGSSPNSVSVVEAATGCGVQWPVNEQDSWPTA